MEDAITRVGDVLRGDPKADAGRSARDDMPLLSIPTRLSPFPGRSGISFPTTLAVVDLGPVIHQPAKLPSISALVTATVHEANTTAEGTRLKIPSLPPEREREHSESYPFPNPMQIDWHPSHYPLPSAGTNTTTVRSWREEHAPSFFSTSSIQETPLSPSNASVPPPRSGGKAFSLHSPWRCR